jgi:hypothetical protein
MLNRGLYQHGFAHRKSLCHRKICKRGLSSGGPVKRSRSVSGAIGKAFQQYYLGDGRAIDAEFPFEKTRQLPQLPSAFRQCHLASTVQAKTSSAHLVRWAHKWFWASRELTNFGAPVLQCGKPCSNKGLSRAGEDHPLTLQHRTKTCVIEMRGINSSNGTTVKQFARVGTFAGNAAIENRDKERGYGRLPGSAFRKTEVLGRAWVSRVLDLEGAGQCPRRHTRS